MKTMGYLLKSHAAIMMLALTCLPTQSKAMQTESVGQMVLRISQARSATERGAQYTNPYATQYTSVRTAPVSSTSAAVYKSTYLKQRLASAQSQDKTITNALQNINTYINNNNISAANSLVSQLTYKIPPLNQMITTIKLRYPNDLDARSVITLIQDMVLDANNGLKLARQRLSNGGYSYSNAPTINQAQIAYQNPGYQSYQNTNYSTSGGSYGLTTMQSNQNASTIQSNQNAIYAALGIIQTAQATFTKAVQNGDRNDAIVIQSAANAAFAKIQAAAKIIMNISNDPNAINYAQNSLANATNAIQNMAQVVANMPVE